MRKNKWTMSVLTILFLTTLSPAIHAQLLFKDFVEAKIFYNNGSYTQEKINYDIVESNLYFIDKRDNEKKVASQTGNISIIKVADRQYVFRQNELTEYYDGTPGIWVGFKFKGRIKAATVGFGGSGNIASVNTYSNFQEGGHSAMLKETEYEVSSVFHYYSVFKNKKICKVESFKQLLKLYKPYSDILQHYINDKKTDFEDVSAIVALIRYAESLTINTTNND